MKQHNKRWVYKGFLLMAALIWGMGTVVVKDTVDALPPGWLVGIRFLCAGTILCVVLAPRMRRTLNADHLKVGAFLGLLVGMSYLTNTTGLTDTTASKSSFLTATYCVLVPFLAWMILRKRPSVFNIVAAVLCIAGVGFVSLQSSGEFSLRFGDLVTLASALFLGLHLAFTSKFAEGRDMLVLTALQFLVAGLVGIFWGALTEPWPTAEQFAPATLFNMGYLVLFASCIALVLQNVGLVHVAPAPASLFLATESIFGTVFSMIFLGDVLNSPMIVGFALIFAAIVVSEFLPTLTFFAQLDARKKALRNRGVSEPIPLEQLTQAEEPTSVAVDSPSTK